MSRIPLPWIQPGSPPHFPPVTQALREPDGLLALGGDLAPERLLAAYRRGIFPWYGPDEPVLWWSPDPRCVFRTDAVHASRRLRRHMRHAGWTITLDRDFVRVMRCCAAPRADQGGGTWIIDEMVAAYTALHRLGHAHSIEIRDGERLVGGLYGVGVGRLFCGESMFSAASGGSKVALVCLARLLHDWDFPLLDAQIGNPHLYRMGAADMPRREFVQHAASLADAEPSRDAFAMDRELAVSGFASA